MERVAKSTELSSLEHPWTRTFLLGALIAGAYFVTGRLGLAFAQHQENATLIWAPTGLSLAALVLVGRSFWPPIAIGALLVNASLGTSFGPTIGITLGNTLEAVCGAWLLTEVARLEPGLRRLRDVFFFLLFGAFSCTLISAGFGVGSLYVFGVIEAGQAATVWLDWWLGDAAGAIVVAPALMVWVRGSSALRDLSTRVETWVILALIAAVSLVSFFGVVPPTWRLLAALLNFPLLVWAGLRLGPAGAVTASALASIVAILGASQGGGPFTGDASLYLMLAYVSIVGTVALLLAATVAEREQADEARLAAVEEQQRLEIQVREKQRLEELGLLAGGVAHDFNNLLVPVIANAEMLSSDFKDDEVASGMLDDIATAAMRASELCEQLLTYAGRTEPTLKVVALPALLREMRRLLGASISKNIEVAFDLDPKAVVLGDPAQLRQLIMNLILNASEAIDSGPGVIRIAANVETVDRATLNDYVGGDEVPSGKCVNLEVSDDGSGMDSATVKRIFDPFFTTKFLGRGLGLAATLGIVRGHRAAIGVSSAEGRGTTFRVLLPCTESVVEESATEKGVVRRASILVADDEQAICRVIQRVLERAGFRVVTASDGQNAIDQFAKHADDIVMAVLDVTMPKRDGKQVLAEIRQRRPEIRAVLTTGYSDERIRDVLDEDTSFLNKPFTSEALESLVAAALDCAVARGWKPAKPDCQ